MGQATFKNPLDGSERQIFVVGFNPHSALLDLPGIAENLEKIRNPGVVLFDSIRRPEFGPIAEDVQKHGKVITEIGGRRVEIDGLFEMGTSFAIDGTVVMSDETFLQVLPYRDRGIIDVGLIRLKPGVNVERTRVAIDRLLPNDVRVLTQAEFVELERHYWATFTPTGFIFKLGVLMALFVGCIIVYQILYSDVSEHLPEYATLKAMGYPDRYLFKLVIQESFILSVLGFVPGVRLLLGAGASVFERHDDFYGALDVCIHSHQVLATRCLLETPHILPRYRDAGYYPLASIAATGNICHYAEILRELLRFGVDLNEHRPSGLPALHTAVALEDGGGLRFLLDGGANVHIRDDHFGNALQCAVALNRISEIAVLLEYGATMDPAGLEENHGRGAVSIFITGREDGSRRARWRRLLETVSEGSLLKGGRRGGRVAAARLEIGQRVLGIPSREGVTSAPGASHEFAEKFARAVHEAGEVGEVRLRTSVISGGKSSEAEANSGNHVD